MSSCEIASSFVGKFRYHRLRPETRSSDHEEEIRDRISKKWTYRFRRIPMRRRFRVVVPGLVRRLWRKKTKVVSSMRKSYSKMKRRLKEGQDHFGDLFAGNYLFLQVNPTSLKYLQRDMSLKKIA